MGNHLFCFRRGSYNTKKEKGFAVPNGPKELFTTFLPLAIIVGLDDGGLRRKLFIIFCSHAKRVEGLNKPPLICIINHNVHTENLINTRQQNVYGYLLSKRNRKLTDSESEKLEKLCSISLQVAIALHDLNVQKPLLR